MKKEKLQEYGLALGLVLILVSAFMPILKLFPQYIAWQRIAFAVGAVIVLVVRISEVYRGANNRVKRLHHIEKIAAVLFCISAFILNYTGPFSRNFSGTDWIAFMLAGAVLQIYTSFAIDKEEKKNAQKPN